MDLQNSWEGIYISDGAHSNTIGGINPGDGNVIAFNDSDGINIEDGGISNRVSGNSIYSNASRGIDLDENNITPNDSCDVDSGTNMYQNFPLITTCVGGQGNVIVGGTFNSTPMSAYQLEFFHSDECDDSGYGEGKVFLGAGQLVLGASCESMFGFSFPSGVNASGVVTATATDEFGNTSQFSLCCDVIAPAVAEAVETPRSFALEQNYPNPFNPSTTLRFSVSELTKARLVVYDLRGSLIKTVFDGMATQGLHEVHFDATGLASGIYFYTLQAEGRSRTMKMVLAR
jgi:hypothetical protein